MRLTLGLRGVNWEGGAPPNPCSAVEAHGPQDREELSNPRTSSVPPPAGSCPGAQGGCSALQTLAWPLWLVTLRASHVPS